MAGLRRRHRLRDQRVRRAGVNGQLHDAESARNGLGRRRRARLGERGRRRAAGRDGGVESRSQPLASPPASDPTPKGSLMESFYSFVRWCRAPHWTRHLVIAAVAGYLIIATVITGTPLRAVAAAIVTAAAVAVVRTAAGSHAGSGDGRRRDPLSTWSAWRRISPPSGRSSPTPTTAGRCSRRRRTSNTTGMSTEASPEDDDGRPATSAEACQPGRDRREPQRHPPLCSRRHSRRDHGLPRGHHSRGSVEAQAGVAHVPQEADLAAGRRARRFARVRTGPGHVRDRRSTARPRLSPTECLC